MPIPLPNLDDRTYDDLVAEARAMIPTLYPTWTNHNPSDPGIALVEMLAWLTDMALYQVDQITDKHMEAFLELLNGPQWALPANGNVDTAVQQTIRALRRRYRAVTAADFEHLLFRVWPQTAEAKQLGADGKIARVCTLPRRNLEAGQNPTAEAPAHISLVILPQKGLDPSDALLEALWTFLEPRRLLTVMHHLVKPTFVTVEVNGRIFIREDVLRDEAIKVLKSSQQGLHPFFDPHIGGPDGTGWPFGRGVYASEIYALLSRLAIVDYVEAVTVNESSQPTSTASVPLQPHQLVKIDLSRLVVVDVYGNEQQLGK